MTPTKMADMLERMAHELLDEEPDGDALFAAALVLRRLADDTLAQSCEEPGPGETDAGFIGAYRRALQEPAPPQDVCRCEQWAKGKAALDSALFMWMNHGGEYTEPPFKFCAPSWWPKSKEEGR